MLPKNIRKLLDPYISNFISYNYYDLQLNFVFIKQFLILPKITENILS